MTVDFFLAASPFQLLCATEAAAHFKDETPQVLILIENYAQNSYASIDKLLTLHPWHIVKKVKVNGRFGFLKQLGYIFYFKTFKVRHLFLADYQGWYFQVPMALNIKRSGKLFLVDDGAGTLVVQKEYLPQLRVYEYLERAKKDRYKKMAFRALGLRTRFREHLNLFSIFDLEPFPGQELVKNELPLFRKAFNSSGPFQMQSVFIGSSLVDNGHFDQEDYLDYIRQAIAAFGEVVYYPHRAESPRMLGLISSIPGLTLHKSTYFIELELIHNNIQPVNIVSFWSTSLYTLNMLFPGAALYILKAKEEEVKSGYFSEVDIVYEYYGKHLKLNSVEQILS